MQRPQKSAMFQLLIEIIVIIALAELLVMQILPLLQVQTHGIEAALTDALLLGLICTPLMLWRLVHYARFLAPSPDSTTSPQIGAASWRTKLASLGLLVIGTTLSLVTAHLMYREAVADGHARFEKQTDLLEREVVARFEKPLFALKSLVGIHAADNGFSRTRFRQYWDARGFQKDYAGVRGFGFIAHVPTQQVERFVAAQRRDAAPDFQIKRLGKTTQRYVITLIEPVELNRAAVGLDIGSEPTRRNAAEEALRTGVPTLTGVITLVQDGRQRPGFLLLVPIYQPGAKVRDDTGRRAHHVGFAYSPIVAEELLSAIESQTLGMYQMALDAAAPEDPPRQIFSTDGSNPSNAVPGQPSRARAAVLTSTRIFAFAGVTFQLRARSTPAFEATVETSRAWLVGISGILLSGLIAFTLWLMASGRDRAERRAKELTVEIQHLAAIARRTNDAVIITDPAGLTTWTNDSFTRITGYSQQEALGQNPGILLQCPQTDPATVAHLAQQLAKRQACRAEIQNRAKDGQLYWLALEIQPLYDEALQFTGFMAVQRDITAFRLSQQREQEQTEALNKSLRETEALMSTINAHAIVSEAGRDGRITRVNEAFCRISGYRSEELLGQDHRLINSGAQDRTFWQDMWGTIAAGRPWRGQICNRAKDGSLYWVDSVIAPFMDAHGRIERYVSIRFDITQARQIEQELVRERQRLASTLEGTNVGTWEVNVITGESRIDERFAGMLGYTLPELLPFTPDKWTAVVHPDDERIARARRQDYMRGLSDSFEMEQRLKHKNGHWIWVLSRGIVATRLPDGHVEWTSGTHMEVTERHLLQEEVQQRNELMSAIIENLPGGLSAFDANLNLILRNTQFADLLQLPESLFAQTPTTFESIIRLNAERGEYGPGDVDQIVVPILDRARHPTAHLLERTRPNGMVLEVRGLPLPGGGFVSTYTDITQRKQTEKEARQADEMLRQAINTLDEAFVIYDAEDRLLVCNQRYRETYPVAAAIMKPGNTFEEIIRYGADRGEYAQAIGRVDAWVSERMRVHLSGNTDIVQELGNGRYLRIVERKTADGYTVGFRIDVSDLMRARIAAEAASKSKSQFLANMSHEIRTPMNAILGMLKLLHNTELSTRQLDYVGKTEGAAKSLLALLNDILDFSKVEAGKMTLEAAPFHVEHLLRDLSVILSSNTGSKNVEVLFDVDPRLPAVLVGDSLRLKQVLINLGGNALKFTEKGMVVLGISLEEEQAGRVTLEFSVWDTGIGIAPENLQRIFEGFSQAEASTTRRFGGTGLGLVISERLVGLMGGQLDVESEVGRGSRFHFRVTLDVADDAPQQTEAAPAAEPRDFQVLIIDDNPVAQQILQAMVEHLGWQAGLANSGDEALTLIRQRISRGQRTYDAVFVDWQMPGMNGWETSLQIRQLLDGQNTPILVMVTAYGREMLAQRPVAEQALLNGFLVKPVTPSMLLDAIADARQSLQGGPARRTLAAASVRRLQGMRVLLVEDNKINQQVAQELLEREGARVTLADNGALGVQAIAAAQPPWDVVLMDVQMPVMDGYTATRKVRHELQLTRLPIIAMTANAMESDRQDAMAAGMNAHVGKPFNLDELVSTMLQHSGYVAPEADGSKGAPLPAQQAPAHAPATFANTAEFDVMSALDRLGGDAGMLGRILQTFARDLPRQPRNLATLLAQGQADEVRRLLHTLKGTAATVGAQRLSTIAAEAEHRLREGCIPTGEEAGLMQARIEAAVAAVTADLVPVLRQLLPRQGDSAAATGTALDRAALQADLAQVIPLLRTSDLAVLDLYAQLRDRHGSALPEELQALDEAISGLDFPLARTLCEQLQQRYTPP